MLVLRGNTAHFSVYYDDTLANGIALADAVLAHCEPDLTTLAGIWVGTPVPAAFQVSLVPGAGGGFHVGTNITCYVTITSDALGISALLVAEVDEVFMSTQKAALGKGFDPGQSHGEGLSRVLAAELYPGIAGRFAGGLAWLYSPRPDWVSNTELTDQGAVSYGCASLFLNYLHYQLGFTWQQIIAAADNTLALVAQNLGSLNAWNDFSAVISRHYPAGQPVGPNQLPKDPEGLAIDNLYPLSCLYIRHNLADDGTSHTGPLANSPDIIVKNGAVANPQATYSTPASIASDTESDAEVVNTHDNFVYLRVWNLGANAVNVTATAYWSIPATLVTPAMWNLIGHSQYAAVPAGRVVRVSTPGITWAQGGIPVPGHYCFIATVGNAGDPEPTPGAFANLDAYVAYIEANNNITWRNFNVVAFAAKHRQGRFREFIALPFLITGAWDRPHVFELEAMADLPTGGRLILEVPAWLGRGLEQGATKFEEHEDADADPDDRPRLRVTLESRGATPLGTIELKADARAASHLLVRVPGEDRHSSFEVAIRQLYQGREVGRITWRLVPDLDEAKETRTRARRRQSARQ
jgi:hypothetical protein